MFIQACQQTVKEFTFFFSMCQIYVIFTSVTYNTGFIMGSKEMQNIPQEAKFEAVTDPR
jgi:ABC-type arginine transport system permease subunit